MVWPPRISRRKVGLPGSGGEKWAPQDRPPQDQQAKSGPFQIACSKVVRMRSWHPDRAPEHRKLGSNRIGCIRMGPPRIRTNNSRLLPRPNSFRHFSSFLHFCFLHFPRCATHEPTLQPAARGCNRRSPLTLFCHAPRPPRFHDRRLRYRGADIFFDADSVFDSFFDAFRSQFCLQRCWLRSLRLSV